MTKTRRKKVPSPLRKVIAANVIARAAIQFRESSNITLAIREASHAAERERLSRSNIQSIVAAQSSPTLEQLEKLARALDLQPYQLLVPALDPGNPQVVRGAAHGEELVYAGIARKAAQEAVKAVLATNGHLQPRKPAKAR